MRVPQVFVFVTIGILSTGCLTTQYQQATQDNYRTANSLIAFEIERDGRRSKEWRQEFTVDGVRVDVTGNGGPGGHVTAKYSDESETRSVYEWRDYFFVKDIRVSPASDILYVAIEFPSTPSADAKSAVDKKITPESRVLSFDLRERKIIADETAGWLSAGPTNPQPPSSKPSESASSR